MYINRRRITPIVTYSNAADTQKVKIKKVNKSKSNIYHLI
jgi:hypothetical protein